MRGVLLAVLITMLAGCSGGTSPERCHWIITKYQGVVDSTGHLTRLVPIDSVQKCLTVLDYT